MNLVFTFLCAAINLKVYANRYNGSLSTGVPFKDNEGIFEKSYRAFYSVGKDAYIELAGPAKIEYPGVVLDDGATLTIQSKSALFKSVQLLREQLGISVQGHISPPAVIVESDGFVQLEMFIAEGGTRFRLGGTTGSDLHLNFVHLKGFAEFECHACSDKNPSEIILGRYSKVSLTQLSNERTGRIRVDDFSKLTIKSSDYCSLGEQINMQQDTSLFINRAKEVRIKQSTGLEEESKMRLDSGSSLQAESLLLRRKTNLELLRDAEILAPWVNLIVGGNVHLKEAASLVLELPMNNTCFLNDVLLDKDQKVWISDPSDTDHGILCYTSHAQNPFTIHFSLLSITLVLNLLIRYVITL